MGDPRYEAVLYKAVLCDIDGVLRHWPPLDTLDTAHGLAPGSFATAAFAPERLIPAITGRVTDALWRSAVEESLAQACGSPTTARAVVTAWSRQTPRVDTGVAALLRSVRRIVPVVLVSNATTRLEHDLEHSGLADLAESVVNSARVGCAKPDPRIYLIAAQRVDTPVHQCLFVDDTAENVTAARGLGMPAIHYRRFEDLQAALAGTLPDGR